MAVDSDDHPCWTIEWMYSPSDFFEEPREVSHQFCRLMIAEGKIKATIHPEYGDPQPEIRDQLHEELIRRFTGGQLIRRRAFMLSHPSVHCKRSTSTVVYLRGAITAKASVHGDITIRNREGDVIADTKAERIERTRRLADLAVRHGEDDLAEKLLDSYRMALNDPDNSLVHLYEIRDAIKAYFGKNSKKARRSLILTKKRWDELERLADSEPLKQGRHRGEMLAGLRDATPDELNLALDIACEMIEKYFAYLDGKTEREV